MKKTLIALPLVALLFLIAAQVQAVSLPQGEAVFETSLQSRISNTDTSMTLVSTTTASGEALPAGYHCFTLDEGRSDAEFVCGTLGGNKTVSSLERGLSYLNGTTTLSSIAHIHRTGADVKVTDFPLVERLRNQANGEEGYPNKLYYDTAPSYSGADSAAFASKAYVDSVAFEGSPDGDENSKGVYQLATGSQAASGTSSGSTGARLALPASLGTSTCQAAGYGVLIASSTTGKLDGNCLNGAYSYTFIAPQTFSGTTTMATTTVASSSVTTLNVKNIAVTGTVTGITLPTPRYTLTVTSGGPSASGSGSGGAATSTALNIPAGVLTGSSTIIARGNVQCNQTSTCNYSLRENGGTVLGSCQVSGLSANNSKGFVEITVANQSATNSQASIGSCMINAVGSGATNTNGVGQSGQTSALSTANAFSLVMVATAGSSNSASIDSFSIIVSP